MTEKELLELKKEIGKLQNTIQEKKGQLKMLQKRLKEEYDCKDEETAKNKLKTLLNDLEKLDEKKEKKIEKIEQLLNNK